MSKNGLFCRIQTLDSRGCTLRLSQLIKDQWAGEHVQSPVDFISKFITLNQNHLKEWLGVDLTAGNEKGELLLHFSPSRYIGCVPIYSPFSGLATSFVEVCNRIDSNEEDIAELLDFVEDTISPEYNKELPLPEDCQVHPPLYMECINYILKFYESMKLCWKKFSNEVRIDKLPRGSTDWTEYSIRMSTDPLSFDKYRNRRNILTTDHCEWHQLCNVLKISLEELSSSRTPNMTKMQYSSYTELLSKYVQKVPLEEANEFVIRMSDPKHIRELKKLANIILKNKHSQNFAWRMDSAVFFERYVQQLVKKASIHVGGVLQCNAKYSISGNKPAWCLQYLEPDMLVHIGASTIVLDAKYKTHMLNTSYFTENLRDTFRSDLHQIMAYTSVNSALQKCGVLIYPYTIFDNGENGEGEEAMLHTKHNTISIHGNFSSTSIHLLGIPLKKRYQDESIIAIENILRSFVVLSEK